jgi:hypothetical protein
MKVTVLLDHDLEGYVVYLESGLAETGWDQLIEIEFVWLRDCGLEENTPDNEVWRYAQEHRLLLLTNNRNNRDASSLHATIARENTPESLPVVTVSDKDSLRSADYRQKAASALAKIIIYPEDFYGTGRVFIP